MINNASNLLNDYTTPKGLKFKFDKDEKILVDSFLFQLGVGFGSLMCIAFITNKRIIFKQTNRQLTKGMKQQAFLNADMKNIYWKDVKEINLGNGEEFSKIFLLGNDGVVIRDFSPEGDTEDKVRGIVTINPKQSLLQMNGDLTYNGKETFNNLQEDINKAFNQVSIENNIPFSTSAPFEKYATTEETEEVKKLKKEGSLLVKGCMWVIMGGILLFIGTVIIGSIITAIFGG